MSNLDALIWRSISSAPRDRSVLVYSLRWGAIVATYSSEFEKWFPRMQCPVSLDGDDVDLITHWMPMPGVPEEFTARRDPWLSMAA